MKYAPEIYYRSHACSHILSKAVAQAQKRVSSMPSHGSDQGWRCFLRLPDQCPSQVPEGLFREPAAGISDSPAVWRPGRGVESEHVLVQKTNGQVSCWNYAVGTFLLPHFRLLNIKWLLAIWASRVLWCLTARCAENSNPQSFRIYAITNTEYQWHPAQ